MEHFRAKTFRRFEHKSYEVGRVRVRDGLVNTYSRLKIQQNIFRSLPLECIPKILLLCSICFVTIWQEKKPGALVPCTLGGDDWCG